MIGILNIARYNEFTLKVIKRLSDFKESDNPVTIARVYPTAPHWVTDPALRSPGYAIIGQTGTTCYYVPDRFVSIIEELP